MIFVVKTFTKETLIEHLKKIRELGWVTNVRHGNSGGVGNTLESLLGIKENNLPIPNAAEWELKCQRCDTSSLTTLFHMEPSPRAIKFVPEVFLKKYGWKHELAGSLYPKTEMSFRQTIGCRSCSDRGFKVVVDRKARKVLISFDSRCVSARHAKWLKYVEKTTGMGELNPQPYWGFDDLFHKAGTKLLNCFFILADCKKEGGEEFFKYKGILILKKFSMDKFLAAIENNMILVDFDARTGHNHGTKFRMKQINLPLLYESSKSVK